MAEKMAEMSVRVRVASKDAKKAEKMDGGTVGEKEHQRADLKVYMKAEMLVAQLVYLKAASSECLSVVEWVDDLAERWAALTVLSLAVSMEIALASQTDNQQVALMADYWAGN